ncbi:hypothetical protein BDQ12DRAFT_712418 [Crucibulum laeve]|uniref:Extracellular membrane protein CFEM domain-containing protein n=1 Tax=Crucibulum laeve TaxID=68775 RepID=A0A5C3M244_9AGAR|nr:hypothetical protein BDQ12DRAFT_712418 [Crucibulum laeve]
MVGYPTFFTVLGSSLLVISLQMVAARPPSLNFLHIVGRSTEVNGVQIPDACKSQCSAAINVTVTCSPTDLSCFCTDNDVNGVVACYNCAVSVGDSDAVSTDTAQNLVNQLVSSCKDNGTPVNSVTVKGANVNGTNVTDTNGKGTNVTDTNGNGTNGTDTNGTDTNEKDAKPNGGERIIVAGISGVIFALIGGGTLLL